MNLSKEPPMTDLKKLHIGYFGLHAIVSGSSMEKTSEKGCELQKIFFNSPETGFVIGSFTQHTERRTFTGKGTIINPQLFLSYNLINGQWSDNHYNGSSTRQFIFQHGIFEKPQDLNGIFRYLVKTTKYVGSTTAQAMLDKYGIDTLNILKNEPERVAKDIKGISEAKARTISEMLIENEGIENAMIEIESLIGHIEGVRKGLSMEIAIEWGASAAEKIKTNPYDLIRFPGVGFAMADNVAINAIKLKPDSIHRKESAVRHCIRELQENSHVWVHRSDVKEQANCLINMSAEDGLLSLIKKRIVIENDCWLASQSDAINEDDIADKIKMLLQGKAGKINTNPFVTCLKCFGAGCEACNFIGSIQDKEEFDI